MTGASGFLGYHVCSFLIERCVPVTGTWLKSPPQIRGGSWVRCDLTDESAVCALVQALSPTHIIHVAAEANTSRCQSNPIRACCANIFATHNLIHAACTLPDPPHFLYISTDLVFDGSKGNYQEDDLPNPIMVYGQTKRLAETLVLASPLAVAVVRCALMYGPPTATGRSSFLGWLVEGLHHGNIVLFQDEFRTPVYVEDLAELLLAMLLAQARGIWHAAGPERTSRYEFGLMVADALGVPRSMITPATLANAQLATPRPKDVSLNIQKAAGAFGFAPRRPQDILPHLLQFFR